MNAIRFHDPRIHGSRDKGYLFISSNDLLAVSVPRFVVSLKNDIVICEGLEESIDVDRSKA